jgi:hypothetical protein
VSIQDAIDVIESVSGFTDESTPVGEAWLEVLSFIHCRPTAQTKPPTLKEQELAALIEERDDAVRQYHYLAQSMVYHGNSVAHWHCKAKAYGDAIGKVWNELQAAGIACDGNKSCAEGVRELAARKSPAIQPQPEPQRKDCPGCEGTPVASNSPCAVCGRAQPVPVSERLPGPGDCDAEGRCWGWLNADDGWNLYPVGYLPWWAYWLPHRALPVPAPANNTREEN